MALKRANSDFSLVTLRALAETEFAKITARCGRVEDHAIMVGGFYRNVEENSAELEAAFNGDRDADEAEMDSVNGGSESEGDDIMSS